MTYPRSAHRHSIYTSALAVIVVGMLVIRRKVKRDQSYTVFMLPGYFKEWPTSDYEHEEILKVFLQDQPHQGIINDFTEYGIGGAESPPRKTPGDARDAGTSG